MQLTDAEIREILIRKKRMKKRKLMKRRRITFVVILVLIIGAAVGVNIYAKKASESKSDSADATQVENSESQDQNAESTEEQPQAVATRGTIFLDAGHGGSDPGSEAGDRRESEDTLELVLEMQDYLESKDFKVVLSRTTLEETVARPDRCAMANNSKADLMVSIHRNKSKETNSASGVEAFVPSFDKGNSQLLAENILNNLEQLGFPKRDIHHGELFDETSDYDELANVTMPACLVEVGFLDSDKDNERFENYNANAQAICDAIIATYESIYGTGNTNTDTNTDGNTDATESN